MPVTTAFNLLHTKALPSGATTAMLESQSMYTIIVAKETSESGRDTVCPAPYRLYFRLVTCSRLV